MKKNSLTELILRDIQSKDLRELPPARVLAGHYRVNMNSIRRSLEQLRTEGCLSFSRGSTIKVLRTRIQDDFDLTTGVTVDYGPGHSGLSATERIRVALLEAIREGRIRAGEALPKIDYLVAQFRAARKTVIAALVQLEADNVISRHSRGRVAGPVASRVKPRRGGGGSPTIVVLQWMGRAFVSILESNFSGGFCRRFLEEAYAANTRILPVVTQGHTSGIMPCGRSEIATTITNLGAQFRGILMVTEAWHHVETNEIAAWAIWCCSLGEPVFWFDNSLNDIRYGQVARAALKKSTDRLQRFRTGLFSEERAVHCALENLISRGHKRIAFVCKNPEDGSWEQRRYHLVQEIAKKVASDVTVWTVPARLVDLWKHPNMTPDQILLKLSLEGPKPVRALIARSFIGLLTFKDLPRDERNHLALAPAILQAIGPDLATAFLLANDTLAFHWTSACKALGIRIPEDVSLVSFDARTEEVYPHEVSSVNLGFDYLGYQACHFILQDIPIKPAPSGVQWTSPKINHDGSLGSI